MGSKRKIKKKAKNAPPKKAKGNTDEKRGADDESDPGSSSNKKVKFDHNTGGLKLTQHGVAYQTKLLMLFYKRGVDQGLPFQLATEWTEAEKFDDIVFIYEKNGKKVHRFLQAKHKQDENKSISVSNLLNVKDGPFSLLKYFDSYCKIKTNSLFSNPQDVKVERQDEKVLEIELQDFIICANIGFDYKSKARNINFRLSDDIFDHVEEEDKLLKAKLTRFKSEFDGKDDLVSVLKNHSKYDESDIDEFFDKLRFAVNYPNEEQLSNILENELGQQFKLVQSEIAYSLFYEKMYNWFKAKEGIFRTNEHYNEMIAHIKEQLSIVQLLGISIVRRKYLSNLKISFKNEALRKIDEFLLSKIDILVLKNEVSVKLSSIKVNQSLANIDKYKADDSVIFISLSTAKNCLTQINHTLNGSSLKGKKAIFVVECDNDNQFDFILLVNTLFTRLPTLEHRIILIISSKNNYSVGVDQILDGFSDSITKIDVLDERNKYSNLHSETQKQLLANQIKFQGELIEMKEVISCKNESDHVKIDSIIDSETITKLIDEQLIEVGTELLNLGEIGNFYVERKLCRLTILKSECLSNEKAIYAFKGSVDQSFLLLKNVKVVENVGTKSDYEYLCEKNPEKIVHWLDLDENKQIVWKWSNGGFAELRKHVETCDPNEIYQPNDFSISDKKILIISAEPGMGKTTILTRLANFSKAKKKSQWIVRISLNDYTDDLKDLQFDDLKAVKEFLVKAVYLKSNFEKQLFYSYFENPEKLIILFDGLDEVSPHYYKEVITMIKLLLSQGVLVWLTTRLHLKASVENDFCTFSYDLVPFNERNQKLFLTSFWKKSVKMNEEKALIFLNEIMILVSESLRDNDREFMGIPLQTQMIAENYENEVHVFCSSNDNQKRPKLPKKLKMLDMYEGFLRKKLEIYSAEKKREKPSNVTVINDNIETFEKKRQNHQLLSLFALYNREHVEHFLTPSSIAEAEKFISNIEQGLDLVGIVMKINNKKPIFVHRTFAEFLAAGYFAEHFTDPKISHFLKANLFKDENQVIRHFLDRILAKNHQLITAILNRDVKLINILIPDEDQLTESDNAGRSALHVASSLGFTYICKQLIAELKSRLKLGVVVNRVDDMFQWSPLLYADNEGRWEVAEVLLDNGADATNMKKINIIDKNVEERGDTQLHISAQLNFLHLAKIIIKNNPHLVHVKNKDYCERMPLNIAAKFGHLKMVQLLVANGADPLQMDDKGNTALDEASIGNHMDIKKFLISDIKKVGMTASYSLPPRRTSNRIRFLRSDTFPRNF